MGNEQKAPEPKAKPFHYLYNDRVEVEVLAVDEDQAKNILVHGPFVGVKLKIGERGLEAGNLKRTNEVEE